MGKFDELLSLAAQVRDATNEYENTANRIGSLFVAILERINEALPGSAINADSIEYGFVEGQFVISMNKIGENGSATPIRIPIPIVSGTAPGLMTSELLNEINQAISNSNTVAQRAESTANNASESFGASLSHISSTLTTLNSNMTLLENSITECENKINSTSSVGNIFNVSVEVPIDG